MISFIKGSVEIFKEKTIIIENNGIGYKVFVTDRALEYALKNKQEVKIYTYMNVKEDEISLFGFFDIDELNIFEKLISISGVGPKGSISLLNAMQPYEIALAIITSDTKALSKGQGIGKKTAERIALELKDKIEMFETIGTDIKIFEDTENNLDKKEAIEALMALGFSKSETVKAINEINEDLSTEKLISKALKVLSK
ncbi:MAG: Holliday junction branch migration protein RuvA [Eubacteriales bacterium]|nr:Holliday junction branch migration protein RuvA [Eubacteriales bacterium]